MRLGPGRRSGSATTPAALPWWDYRGATPQAGKGMRIDLILASRPLRVERLGAVLIDRNARKGESPPTTPLLADSVPPRGALMA